MCFVSFSHSTVIISLRNNDQLVFVVVTDFVLCGVGTELSWMIYINPMWDLWWTKWHWDRFLWSDSALYSKSRHSPSSTRWSCQQEEREKPGKLEIKQCPSEDGEHREENRLSIFSVLKLTSGYFLWVFISMFLLFPSTRNKFILSFHSLLLFLSSSHSFVCFRLSPSS